jgi:hypothetical protein
MISPTVARFRLNVHRMGMPIVVGEKKFRRSDELLSSISGTSIGFTSHPSADGAVAG